MNPTVPCKVCGTLTEMTGTKLCDPCWEVQRHVSEVYIVWENKRVAAAYSIRKRAEEHVASCSDKFARVQTLTLNPHAQ